MAITFYCVFALCLWQVCDGVETKDTIRHTLRALEHLKYKGKELERCAGIFSLAENISPPHLQGETKEAIKLTFQLASKLFMKDTSHSGWKSHNLHAVDDLLSRGSKGSIPPVTQELRDYFEELEELLSLENFSMCAWETVRKEVYLLFLKAYHLAIA